MNLDEEDLSKEVYPLAHYISNRKKLINEVFSILKGPRLESTTPPSLKGIDVVELKSLCLEELEKLDSITILDVIEGKLKATSPQRSPPRIQEVAPEPKKRKSSETFIPLSTLKKKIKQSLKGADEAGVKVQIRLSKKKKEKKKKDKKNSKKENESDAGTVTKKKGKAKAKKTKKEKKAAKTKKKEENVQEEVVRPTSHTGERTLMELLELEYRAKAIKALLKSQGIKGVKLDQVFNDDDDDASRQSENGTDLSGNASVPSSTSQAKNGENGDAKGDALPPQLENVKSTEHVLIASEKSTVLKPDSEIQADDKSNDEVDEETEHIPTNSIQPKANKTVSSLNESDEDELDYRNPDDLGIQDELTKPVSSSSSSDSSESSSGDEEEVENLAADDETGDAGVQNDIEGASDVSEEEDGELGDDNKDTHSVGSTPPQLSPAYSDAGDYQVTLRNTPSPASPSHVIPESEEAPEDFIEDDEQKNIVTSVVEELSEGEIDENEVTTISPVADGSPVSPEQRDITECDKSVEVDRPTEVEPEALPEDTLDQTNLSEHVPEVPVLNNTEKQTEPSSEAEKVDDDEMAVNARIPSDHPDEASPITWYERWYSSEKVQQVVSSTKMYGKVRSKLKTDKQAKLKSEASEEQTAGSPNPNAQPAIEDDDVPIIGSIEEYEKLFGRKIVEQNLDNITEQEPEVSAIPLPPESPEEASEAEDDDLWGDILGGS